MSQNSQSRVSQPRYWALPVLLLGVLLAVFGLRQLPRTGEAPAGTPEEPALTASERIQLTIDFGDGRRLEISAPGEAGTALAALQLGSRSADLPEPEVSGQGGSALVTAIGGVANQGAGGRNWIFEVNEQLADRSAGVSPVQPGDRVLWRLSERE